MISRSSSAGWRDAVLARIEVSRDRHDARACGTGADTMTSANDGTTPLMAAAVMATAVEQNGSLHQRPPRLFLLQRNRWRWRPRSRGRGTARGRSGQVDCRTRGDVNAATGPGTRLSIRRRRSGWTPSSRFSPAVCEPGGEEQSGEDAAGVRAARERRRRDRRA